MGGGLSSSRGWVRHGDAWFHPSGKVLRIDEVDDYRQWYANRNNTARVPAKHPFAGLIAFGRALDSAADVTLTVTAAVNPIAGAIKAGVTLADTGVAYSKGEADEADLAMAVVDAAASGAGLVGKAAKLGAGAKAAEGGVNSRLSGKNPPISPRQKLHTNGTPGKSQFRPDVDADSVTRTAWEHGVPEFNKHGKFIGKRHTFETPVGMSPSGHDQYSVFVHSSPTKGIHGVPTTTGVP